MGGDKSRLKFHGQTLLSYIRAVAKTTGRPVRILRRDLIPHCGPLSGILTALTRSSKDAVLFLACDMPLISPGLLQKIIRCFAENRRPLFTKTESAGFPFILPREVLPVIQKQVSAKYLSLHSLAKKIKAQSFEPTPSEMVLLFNVNTPDDWEKMKEQRKIVT